MSRFLTPLPKELHFADPVVTIATFGGSGLLRPAPGTWGTLAAVFAGWPIAVLGGPVAMSVAAVAAFLAGLWATERYIEASGNQDPSEVVIDEVAAMWLVMAALPPTPLAYLLGFVFFRLFDIWKPWPIRGLERRVKGEMGVMVDDMVAAIYAIIAAWVAGMALFTV
ncbi:phosphatidylglycerophosphatase A [Pyruvatibacter mobilis]|uniref:phosphatidylglycerophosphatase A family protein n=1 Tax=Pyruvatibacter mobilis TaxID=1712261 RepID=UPI003BAB0AB6